MQSAIQVRQKFSEQFPEVDVFIDDKNIRSAHILHGTFPGGEAGWNFHRRSGGPGLVRHEVTSGQLLDKPALRLETNIKRP